MIDTMNSTAPPTRSWLTRLLPPVLPDVGRLPYLWALYALIILLPYAFGGQRGPAMWLSLATVVLLLWLYFRSFHAEGRALWAHALGMSALGLALSWVNPNAAVCFTFSACCGAGFEQLKQGLRLLGLNLLLIGVAALGWQSHANFWVPGLVFTIMAALPVMFSAQTARAQKALLRQQEEVEQLAKLAERGRIARDMHDVLGHELSVIVLKSQLAQKLLQHGDTVAGARELADIERATREALQQVRGIVDGYRSGGLAEELQRARQALGTAGIALVCEGEAPAMAAAQEQMLALSLREAITNVLRHAGASACRLRWLVEPGAIVCEFSDNGRGLGSAAPGNGLMGLQERLQQAGGSLSWQDAAPGLRLQFRLPA